MLSSNYSSAPIMVGETVDASDNIPAAKEWLGRTVIREIDKATAGIVRTRETASPQKMVLMKNVGTTTLVPKKWYVTSKVQTDPYGYLWAATDTLATAGTKNVFVVDPELPASGVPVGHLFWAIVGGPCTILTPAAQADFGAGVNDDWAVGSDLMIGSEAGAAGIMAVTDLERLRVGTSLVARDASEAGQRSLDTKVMLCIAHWG